MGLILNLETATEICSVALSRQQQLLSVAEIPEGFQHAKQLNLLVEQCLDQAGVHLKQLDAIALSNGPGSYTGLRVGAAAAKAYAFALDIPLITVDTLECIAYGSVSRHEDLKLPLTICPMLDARRMDVYTALFDGNMEIIRHAEALTINEHMISRLKLLERPLLVCGNGAIKLKTFWSNSDAIFDIRPNSATSMIEPAWQKFQKKNYSDADNFALNYLKTPHITQARKVL